MLSGFGVADRGLHSSIGRVVGAGYPSEVEVVELFYALALPGQAG